MKAQKRFFFSENRLPVSVPFEIGKGDCSSIPPTYSTIYMVDKGPNYIPILNDVLFVDPELTIPFVGKNSKWKIGILIGGGAGAILVYNFEYTIDNSGVITLVSPCIIQGGDSGSVIGETHTACYACMIINVSVPSGTRDITITKSGNAGYAGPSAVICNSGTFIQADLIETISADKTYSFGIDAAVGNGNSNTTITLQVDTETPIVLTHIHETPVVNC